MMGTLLSLFAFTVYAAEAIVSPLPDSGHIAGPPKTQVTFAQLISPLPDSGQVLGATTVIASEAKQSLKIAAPSERSRDDITPTSTVVRTRKNAFTIALLGDSMIDTLGPDIPDLGENLSSRFAGVQFKLLNYGVGGTNIEYGIERITNGYEYLGKQIPSLASQHPDIVVVESFGYNPFPDANGGMDRHWLALAKAVDTLKTSLPGVRLVIAATIAPNAAVFGDGAAGIAFSRDDKWQRVDVIKKYLESTVAFAKSQHLPLADAFHPSLGSDGNGNLRYINAGDHIHTSPSGRAFFAQIVADAITANHLLE